MRIRMGVSGSKQMTTHADCDTGRIVAIETTSDRNCPRHAVAGGSRSLIALDLPIGEDEPRCIASRVAVALIAAAWLTRRLSQMTDKCAVGGK